MKAGWAKHEPWWDGAARPRKEAAIATRRKLEAIEAHSPITADVLRACRIDLVKRKSPAPRVQPGSERLQITLDELAALLSTPADKLKDFTPLADPLKVESLLAKDPALYRVIHELAKRTMPSRARGAGAMSSDHLRSRDHIAPLA